MKEKYNERIFEAIRNNDRRGLQDFYNEHRTIFKAWCFKNFQTTESEAIDIYQQAYLILYNNVLCGTLNELKSKPLTYLCSIGRNLILQRRRINERETRLPIDQIEEQETADSVLDTIEEEERHEDNKALVRHLLTKIGDPCSAILKMLFVKGMHPEAVAAAMNYSDARVLRKRKSLCLKRLRAMVQEEANQNFSQDNELD